MRVVSYKEAGYERFVKSLDRRAEPAADVKTSVEGIVEEVRSRGDRALIDLTKKFDRVTLTPKSLLVSDEEFAEAAAAVEGRTKRAIAASKAANAD